MPALNFGLKPLFVRVLLPLFALGVSQQSVACGGFFCDAIPINQAAEQIVFRQVGSETTAMIKIDYVGNAEDFGWVLPVPEIPEISLGSDQIFTTLELATRPQFSLKRQGEECYSPSSSSEASVSSSSSSLAASSSSFSAIVIEKSVSVGAFDAQVVSSDDADALALWLAENNLDLTDKGSELLAPYIQAKQKFVVLKLKSNTSVGSIQPIILKYQSDTPVIPMTLTAVAAQNDMGVLVWLLGNGRGVPKNFKHVTPNYTRLNWFSGTRSAYISYQNLITLAMNEADGQGFATDFAGYMPDLADQFPSTQQWKDSLELWAPSSDANFISLAWDELDPLVQSVIRLQLPTSNSFVYSDAVDVATIFTEEQLQLARAEVLRTIKEQVVAPLDDAIDILDDNLYLTRLYTTLSADEMGINPSFTYNTAMPEQPLERNATLTAKCVNEETNWTLNLGEGTGRDDELVIDAWDDLPFGALAQEQRAMWTAEKTSSTADPVLLDRNKFEVLRIGESSFSSSEDNVNDSTDSNSSVSSKSGGSVGGLFMWFLSILLVFKLHARYK